MSDNLTISVNSPPVMTPLGQAEGQLGQKPVAIEQPPLRTPQEVLAESRQRFPQVDEKVLTGEHGLSGLTAAQTKTVEKLAKQQLPRDMAPIMLQSGGALKTALMPTRGVPGPDKAANVQGYVREGQALYDRLMNGDASVPRGKDEVAKVMWFLQALASSKASESSGGAPPVPSLFKEGAFSIEDPEHRLENFLAGTHSYERKSSHLEGFQKLPGCQPRGVDIRGVPMPNERKTVLFARMPGANELSNTTATHMGDKGFLFLKMEPHGCRGLGTGGTGRAGEGHASVGKEIKRFFANLFDTIGHAFGFLQSQGQRSGLAAINGQNNRERVPSDMKELYTGFAKQLETLQREGSARFSSALGRQMTEALGRGDPLSPTGGIRVMLRNLEQVKNMYESLPPEQRAMPALAPFAKGLDDALTLLRAHGDHAQYRIGNEIILTRGDTAVSGATRVGRPDHQVIQEGGMLAEDKAVVLAAQRYVLANIDNKDLVDVFEKDTHRCTYHLGLSGQEQPVTQNTALAKDIVLNIADGDERVAKALMTLCNQSFAQPLTNSMLNEGIMSAQSYVLPGNVGDYHISRLPDTPEGAKNYRVGFSFDGPLGQEGQIFTLAGTLGLDESQSRVRGQMFMNVTFHPGGAIEPAFDGEPSFGFTLTPAASGTK